MSKLIKDVLAHSYICNVDMIQPRFVSNSYEKRSNWTTRRSCFGSIYCISFFVCVGYRTESSIGRAGLCKSSWWSQHFGLSIPFKVKNFTQKAPCEFTFFCLKKQNPLKQNRFFLSSLHALSLEGPFCMSVHIIKFGLWSP